MDRELKTARRRILRLAVTGALLFLLLAGDFCRLALSRPADAGSDGTSSSTVLRTRTVSASRGEIYDRNGVPLVTNRPVYVLCFDRFGWRDREACRVIRDTLALLSAYGIVYTDRLPLTHVPPWRFTCEAGSAAEKRLRRFLSAYGIAGDAAADDAAEQLCRTAGMPDGFTPAETRRVLGVLYDMVIADFSYDRSFVLAEDVPLSLIAEIEEQPDRFPGVTAEIRAVRQYETVYAAHVLGSVGPIPAEESDAYAALGYPMDASVGRGGVERAFEERLRGRDGARLVETDAAGQVLRTVDETPARSGEDVFLTLDLRLQRAAEDALARQIAALREAGAATGGGAAAAVSVKNGEVLVLASRPTYDPARYRADYAALAADPEKPLFNRAIAGLYAPGSTFKMITAAAALDNGAVTPETLIDCEGVYTHFAPDWLYRCWIWGEQGVGHGSLNAAQALRESCNCYFYEAGRLTGIGAIDDWASRFGLGQRTGIELPGEAAGVIAGPETHEGPWYAGDTLLAAIGQSDHLVTPLQLAGYAAALANGGSRCALHLLLRTEYGGETAYRTTPVPLPDAGLTPEFREVLREGMLAVTEEGTAARIFADFPIPVLGKSGSAQVGGGQANGVFLLAAPADDPEIAVAVVLEHGVSGNNAARVARDILAVYFGVPAPEP